MPFFRQSPPGPNFVGALVSTILQAFRVSGDTEDRLTIRADGRLDWGGGAAARDVFLRRSAVGTLETDGSLIALSALRANSGAADQMTFDGGFIEGAEIADPAAPAANIGRLYFRDNGVGKTQLVVRFPTGLVQVIATEP